MSQAVCRICDSTRSTERIAALRQSRFSVRRCLDCGVEYMFPQPSFEEIRQLYTAEYYKAWGMADGETQGVARMKRLSFATRFPEIKKHVSSGRILDVGTASGFFLEVAREQGFDPYGVELSEYAGGIAARKFGPGHIHIGTLDTAPFEPESFSVIAMSDLIEHVQDPIGTLGVARKLLRPDGVLMLVTPDTSSLTNRLMGSKWPHYHLEHLFYWSRRSIHFAAAKAGFRVLTARSAAKVVSCAYVQDQFSVHRHWLFTPASRMLAAIIGPLAQKNVHFTTGDMMVLLRRDAK